MSDIDIFSAASTTNGHHDAPPPDDEHPGLANDDVPQRIHYTDTGNARRLVAAWGHLVRHVGPWGAWLIWDGRRWKIDTRGEVIELAKRVAVDLWQFEVPRAEGDARKDAVKWAMQSENAGRIRAMVELARSDPNVAIDPQQLDHDRWLLNVSNGTIDLRTGRRRDHRQKDLITKVAAVHHDPDATAPQFEQFLARILPDEDVRAFVQRWFGYCLTGDVGEHKILFAFGAGANGKSTLLNVIAHVLGDYARQAAPDLLMRRRDDPHPTGLADLQGARLVLASETAENRRLDEALVKRLTGGDRIKARHMFQDFFEFDPTHKFVVATNHRPEVTGTDHGIWRRIRLLPFSIVIPDDEQDQQLEQKLRSEAAGILNWALAGARAWRQSGLTEPTAVVAATAEYRAAMDIIGDFISDCCVLANGVAAKAGDLFRRYGQWCEAMGEPAMSQRKFGEALGERGLQKYRSGGHWWGGIALRASSDQPDDGPFDTNGPRETAGQDTDRPWLDL